MEEKALGTILLKHKISFGSSGNLSTRNTSLISRLKQKVKNPRDGHLFFMMMIKHIQNVECGSNRRGQTNNVQN